MNAINKEEWNNMCLNVAQQMGPYVKDYITSISLEVSETAGRHVGSGTYIKVKGEYYILTNDHVAKERLKGSLGHTLKEGKHVYRIINSFRSLEYPVDAAIVQIDKKIFEKSDRKAVPVSRIKQQFSTVENELLCIQGFPGKKSRMSPLLGALISRSLPYITQEMPLPEGYNPEYFFAIHYPYDLLLTTTENKCETLPDPQGMSGSVVWDTGYVAKQGQNWTPDDASVIGLIREWNLENHALIGVRIEKIREFLVRALQSELVD